MRLADGEMMLFWVNVPATLHGLSDTSKPMSRLSVPGVLIPAKTAPAEKPLAEVTVPLGTDAI